MTARTGTQKRRVFPPSHWVRVEMSIARRATDGTDGRTGSME